MDVATQLSVFVANKPGTLAAVCDELARAKVNIFALTIADAVDHAVVRMVVDDTHKALMVFGEHGTLVLENDVLMLETDNRPGTLAELTGRLAKHRINLEYAYCATAPRSKRGLLILRVSNTKKALDVLGAK